jgi:hypothetical protein
VALIILHYALQAAFELGRKLWIFYSFLFDPCRMVPTTTTLVKSSRLSVVACQALRIAAVEADSDVV